MKFSFIIPVFNRPEELSELLESLKNQNFKNFEAIIVEDGSTVSSQNIVELFGDKLTLQYHYQSNQGPAIARTFGATKASGEFLIFTDSDCILPEDYLDIIDGALLNETEVFGGPDKTHPDFNRTQKAISYSMTSVLTTGGVRGQKKSIETFYPRSFNMGIKKYVFDEIGGFPKTTMWPGEDMVLAIELIDRGYKLQYIHEAFVYHKRRTSLLKFFKQVKGFGNVRLYIAQVYPWTFKVIYLFPTVFILFAVLSLFSTAVFSWKFLLPLSFYFTAILIHSSIQNKSIYVGLLSILTTFFQFSGYAIGLSYAFYLIYIVRRPQYILDRNEMFKKHQL